MINTRTHHEHNWPPHSATTSTGLWGKAFLLGALLALSWSFAPTLSLAESSGAQKTSERASMAPEASMSAHKQRKWDHFRQALSSATQASIADLVYLARTRDWLRAEIHSQAAQTGLSGAALEAATQAGNFAASTHLEALSASLQAPLLNYFRHASFLEKIESLGADLRAEKSKAQIEKLAQSVALKWMSGLLIQATEAGASAIRAVAAQYPDGAFFQLSSGNQSAEIQRIGFYAAKSIAQELPNTVSRPAPLTASTQALLTSVVLEQAQADRANRQRLTRLGMKQLLSGLDELNRRCGVYPTTAQGLGALLKKLQSLKCKNYDDQGFIARLPQDAWGQDFHYSSDGTDFEIRSLGADRKVGGLGAATDLVYRAGTELGG